MVVVRWCWMVGVALGLCLVCACAPSEEKASEAMSSSLDRIGAEYTRLVLAVGQHDADYVDAFYGPEEWKEQAASQALDLTTIRTSAEELATELMTLQAGDDEMVALRHKYLSTQLASLLARVSMLEGATLSFDEESQALYGAVAPDHPDAYFQAVIDELDGALPGSGDLAARLDSFKRAFVIPPDRLDAVFRAAIDACRERTAAHLDLPEGESFVIEYVTDKSWSGYNWYQGGFKSLIQVNTDLPIYIDRAVDLACHEGYPGHHVYNVLLEKHLVRDRGWGEFQVYPLFSPQSLIAEGTANYGIDVTFPGGERIAFERETLFPLAGLDASQADLYYRVMDQVGKLSYAGNQAARRFLDGEIDAAAAADYLTRYALTPPDRAEQRVRFMQQYRAYVINYNLGKDLVRDYVQKQAGDPSDPDQLWNAFGTLLASPRLPADLQ